MIDGSAVCICVINAGDLNVELNVLRFVLAKELIELITNCLIWPPVYVVFFGSYSTFVVIFTNVKSGSTIVGTTVRTEIGLITSVTNFSFCEGVSVSPPDGLTAQKI